MNFISLTFLLFLPLILVAYWAVAQPRRQNMLLIAASYTFYGWWDYRFCGLMLISSLVDYAIAICLEQTKEESRRRWLLAGSLLSNLSLLGFFKYFNFFAENLQALAASVGWKLNSGTLEIILPVGISFYTFQTLSYTIDVYRRKISATRSLVDYLAFVSFFPQLVAGPIERASNLLPQFARRRQFDPARATDGCRQILWGFVKKIAVADQLALIVDKYYADPVSISGGELALATCFFAFQIYCDFSAYSDIAIGTAKLFDIRLMRNFAYPYFSQSLSEFWRRWHISLSTWFRDYVYVPLGGSRTSTWRRAVNTLLTFLISGLWHGAAWKFVIWGGINGTATAIEQSRQTGVRAARGNDVPGGEALLPSLSVVLRMAGTFALVCLCWIFFRAANLGQALFIVQKIIVDVVSGRALAAVAKACASDASVLKAILVLTALVSVEWVQRRHRHPLQFRSRGMALRWATYTLLIWGTMYLMPTKGGGPFIYFQF